MSDHYGIADKFIQLRHTYKYIPEDDKRQPLPKAVSTPKLEKPVTPPHCQRFSEFHKRSASVMLLRNNA